MGGLILISFSFSGKAIAKVEKNISAYLIENNIELLEMECIGAEIYILGQKTLKDSTITIESFKNIIKQKV